MASLDKFCASQFIIQGSTFLTMFYKLGRLEEKVLFGKIEDESIILESCSSPVALPSDAQFRPKTVSGLQSLCVQLSPTLLGKLQTLSELKERRQAYEDKMSGVVDISVVMANRPKCSPSSRDSSPQRPHTGA